MVLRFGSRFAGRGQPRRPASLAQWHHRDSIAPAGPQQHFKTPLINAWNATFPEQALGNATLFAKTIKTGMKRYVASFHRCQARLESSKLQSRFVSASLAILRLS